MSITEFTVEQVGKEILDSLPEELKMNPKLRIILGAIIGVEIGILWLLKR